MLTGARNVAWGTAIVVAGLLAVALADSVWIILFFSDARSFFFPPRGFFGNELSINSQYMFMESLLSLVLVIWLIALGVRRAAKSIAAGRS